MGANLPQRERVRRRPLQLGTTVSLKAEERMEREFEPEVSPH